MWVSKTQYLCGLRHEHFLVCTGVRESRRVGGLVARFLCTRCRFKYEINKAYATERERKLIKEWQANL